MIDSFAKVENWAKNSINMSVFNKSKGVQLSKTTKGFYFGHTEAEGENKHGKQNLDHYFEDYLSVLPQIEDEKFIFIGRKGTGKSAIAKFIKDSSDKESDSFCDLIKFNDIELEKIVQSTPKEYQDNIELLIFEWLILVRLIKLFVQNKSAIYTTEYKKLKDFIERNSGFIDIDKYSIVEITTKLNLEIKIEVLKHILGPSAAKYVDSKTVKAPFYQFINPLKEIVAKVLSFDVFKNKEYIILFDDLDIKFKSDNDAAIEKLLSLLRVVKNLNTTLFKEANVKILVFLRDDIKKNLETRDSDTSKLFSSYEIILSWYDHTNFKISENQINLKRFINKRIAINFESNNIHYDLNDPWQSLFKSNNFEYNGKSSFKYVLDNTFYRPRDLILFLSFIGTHDYNYPIDSRIVRNLLNRYINENVKELKSELSIHFDEQEIRKIFIICKTISLDQERTKSEIYTIISKEFTDTDMIEKVFTHLVSYSILIYKDSGGKLYFNYRENNDELVDFGKMSLTLHKCIYNFLYPELI